MERPKLTPNTAELIVNFLRNNPGVSMTLAQLSDELTIPVADLGAYLEELDSHNLVIKETTSDGFDTFRFPDEYQRSTGTI